MVYKFIEDLDLLEVKYLYPEFFEDACRELGADDYCFPCYKYDKLYQIPKDEAEVRLEPLVRGMFAFAEEHYCERTSTKFRMTRDYYGIGTPKLTVKKIAKKYNLAEWVVRGTIQEKLREMTRGIFEPWGYFLTVAMYLPGEEFEHFLDAMRENRAVIKKECKHAVPILKCIDAK